MKKQLLAMLAVLFLVVAPTLAQEATTEKPRPAGVTVTTSEATIQVSGSAGASKTGLAESVTFSGNVVIHATVVTDPAMPTSVTLFVDGKGIKGVGETGTVYINSCEANLTRLFRPTDKITLTFAFFEDKKSRSFLKSKTGVVTINLTYDEKTRKLTSATGAVGTL